MFDYLRANKITNVGGLNGRLTLRVTACQGFALVSTWKGDCVIMFSLFNKKSFSTKMPLLHNNLMPVCTWQSDFCFFHEYLNVSLMF